MLAADLQIHKIGINKVKKKLPLFSMLITMTIITMTMEARVPRLKIFRSEKSSLMINISKL